MPDISIHNETEYDLTPVILDQIKRDAQEYFGETVHAIRVQYGIERHAFNAKTGEVRYAFSPNDYGLLDTTPLPDTFLRASDVPTIDDDTEDIDDADFDDDIEVDDETETPFARLDEDIVEVEDDDGPQFQSLDTDFDSIEDEDRDFYDDDYD